MRYLAAKGKGIATRQHKCVFAYTIFQLAFQHMDEFGSWVLKRRKFFTCIIQRNQEGFKGFLRTLVVGKQMIGMAHFCAAPHYFHAPVSYTHLRAHETDSYLVCR